MKTKRITALLLLLTIAGLCIAGTKLSKLTRTRTIQANSKFYVVTQDVSGRLFSREIEASDLGTNLAQWIPGVGLTPFIGNNAGRGTNTDLYGLIDVFGNLNVSSNTYATNGSFIQTGGGTAAQFQGALKFTSIGGNIDDADDALRIFIQKQSAGGTLGLYGAGAQAGITIDSDGDAMFSRTINSLGGASINWGSGSPEGVVTASVGSAFFCTNGCTSSGAYIKTNGTSSTGWWLIQGGGSGGGGGGTGNFNFLTPLVVSSGTNVSVGSTLSNAAGTGFSRGATNSSEYVGSSSGLGTNATLRGLTLPSVTASRALVIDASGNATNASGTPDGTKFLADDNSYKVPSGGGDVSAASNFGTDNLVLRSDGILKGAQSSAVSISDAGAVTGASSITSTGAVTAGSMTINSATSATTSWYDAAGTEYFQFQAPADILTSSVLRAPTNATAGVMVAQAVAAGTNQQQHIALTAGQYVTYDGSKLVASNLPPAGVGGSGGGAQVTNVALLSGTTTNLTIDLGLASTNHVVFKVAMLTNTHVIFSNALLRAYPASIVWQQDTNGGRSILSLRSTDGLVQTRTNADLTLTTDPNGLDVWTISSAYFPSNVLVEAAVVPLQYTNSLVSSENTYLFAGLRQRILQSNSAAIPPRIAFMGDSMIGPADPSFLYSAVDSFQLQLGELFMEPANTRNPYGKLYNGFAGNYTINPAWVSWYGQVTWGLPESAYVTFIPWTNVNRIEVTWIKQAAGNAFLGVYTNNGTGVGYSLCLSLNGSNNTTIGAWTNIAVPLGNYGVQLLTSGGAALQTNVVIHVSGQQTNSGGANVFMFGTGGSTMSNYINVATTTKNPILAGLAPDVVFWEGVDIGECGGESGYTNALNVLYASLTNACGSSMLFGIIGIPHGAGGGIFDIQNAASRLMCQRNDWIYLDGSLPHSFYTNGMSADDAHYNDVGGALGGASLGQQLGLFSPATTTASLWGQTLGLISSRTNYANLVLTNHVVYIPQEFNGSNGTSGVALTNNWDLSQNTWKSITNVVGTNLTFNLSNTLAGFYTIGAAFKGNGSYTNTLTFLIGGNSGTNITWLNWATNGTYDVLIRPNQTYIVQFFANKQSNILAWVRSDDPYVTMSAVTFQAFNAGISNIVATNAAVRAGAGTSNALVGGTLFFNTTDFTNCCSAVATLTNAQSFAVPAHTLTNNGDTIRWWAAGLCANAKATTNDIAVLYGTTTLLDTGAQIASNRQWTATGTITRTGASSQIIESTIWWPGPGSDPTSTNRVINGAEVNGVANTIQIKLGSTQVAVLTNKYFKVAYEPAVR